jgi:microtubule-associated protein-like 6
MKWTNAQSFVTVGIKHYKVWNMEAKTIKGKTGQFGKSCNILTSLVVKDNKVYTGASDGSLHVWMGNSLSKTLKKHDKSLNTLCIYKSVLLTASSDATICILRLDNLNELVKIDCKLLFTESVNK